MLLKILPLCIRGPHRSLNVFALLDEGSTITLIDKNFAKILGLRGSKLDIKLTGFQDEKLITNCEKVTFELTGSFGKHEVKNAIAADNLKLPFQTISEQFLDNLGEISKELKIRPYYNAHVKLLIGQDNSKLIATRELIEINDELAASRSLLGWALHGPAVSNIKQKHAVLSLSEPPEGRGAAEWNDSMGRADGFSKDEELDGLIKFYFEMESVGVNEGLIQGKKSNRAIKLLEDTSRRVGDYWETGLLWKDDFAPLVDSRLTARNRLASLERRLDRDSTYAELYYREMQRFIDLGYAVKVDKNKSKPRVWYLPHFGVYNENKPDKIRLVFDAAAKTSGISLNDQLDTGPDLLRSLAGILVGFREEPIAIKADISDMFLRVKMTEKDRGAQRFLWRGRSREIEPEEYEMTCLIFGSKSSPTSAIHAKNKNAESFKDQMPIAAESIIDNSYMDDYLASRRTVKEATELTRDVIKINSKAGFQMHGWSSNNAEVMKEFAKKGLSTNEREMQLGDKGKERVLGLFWDTRTDELKFNVELAKIPKEILSGKIRPSKREILRVIMSVFDPLGLLAPFTLRSKILMQQTQRSGVSWDKELRDEEYGAWLDWISKVQYLKECRVPRCYSPAEKENSRVELHVFSDASLIGYAAAAYLRFESPVGDARVSLIMAKSRIAPLKPMTVPRLELQAALLGSKLADFLKKEIKMKISGRFFWSDSTTVLQWIRSEPRQHNMYVANRLAEISELTRISEWRWVPSEENPADDATRLTNDALVTGSRWFFGPNFLRNLKSTWPVEKFLSRGEKSDIDKLELNKAFTFTATTKPAIDYRALPITLRLLGWRGLLVHARRLCRVLESRKNDIKLRNPVEWIRKNEEYWYRVIQSESFETEINALKNGKNVHKHSKIAMLYPYLDKNQILRAKGRAENGPDEVNNPIILHSKHFATKYLIAEYHRRYYHSSSNTVVNELRQKYYIFGLRVALRSLTSRCVVCRLRRGKPREPLMAPLPAGRMAVGQRPFSHCGVDYFGPLSVKIGRRREKRWGVLFTCLTTRAVHLEIAHSLNTSSAIMALQRLAARRGSPAVVYSDNGTNLRGANKELKEAIAGIDWNRVRNFATTRRIEWRFNPPDAPHMGGAWERLIGSVKKSIYAVLKDQAPSQEVLCTIFAEVEHSVNSRPLTHVSLDPRDKEALTPNHFLLGSSSGALNLGKYDEKRLCLRKEWKIAQHYAEAFWKRWLREYLPTLITRKKWTMPQIPLEVGDIVLIIDLAAQRNDWRRGTITRVFPGKDRQVRVAEIRTSTGIFMRPAHKLVKLLGSKEVQN